MRTAAAAAATCDELQRLFMLLMADSDGGRDRLSITRLIALITRPARHDDRWVSQQGMLLARDGRFCVRVDEDYSM